MRQYVFCVYMCIVGPDGDFTTITSLFNLFIFIRVILYKLPDFVGTFDIFNGSLYLLLYVITNISVLYWLN